MDCPRREYTFHDYVRADGQRFSISAILYELPTSHNYWQASYGVKHEQWGHMKFSLSIPKSIAANAGLAAEIVTGSAALQVCVLLEKAGENGMDMVLVFGDAGWVLTG